MFQKWQLFTFLAFLFYGSWGFWGAKTSAEVGAKSAIIYSSLGTLCVALLALVLLHFKPQFSIKGISFGMLTGISTGLGTIFFIAALRIGTAIPIVIITALYPLVTTLLLILFFHQTLNLRIIIGIILSTLAIVLLSAK